MNGLAANLCLEEEVLFGLRPRPAPARRRQTPARPARPDIPPGLAGLRAQAQRDTGKCFTSLLHYVDVELLRSAYRKLESEGIRGGGGVTWQGYGHNLHANIVRLYTRLQRGAHRTLPSWRRAAALARGRRGPLKRAALKDRIVQRAVAEVLHAVFQADFVEFACEWVLPQPRCDARERLGGQSQGVKLRWIVEADRMFPPESIGHKSLMCYLEQRIGDARLLELIRQWIHVGILEDLAGHDKETDRAPRSPIAALLAHIYWHYALDIWSARWRQRHARSTVLLARDPARLIAAFEHKSGARRFLTDLRVQMAQFAPARTTRQARLIAFSHYQRQHLQRFVSPVVSPEDSGAVIRRLDPAEPSN